MIIINLIAGSESWPTYITSYKKKSQKLSVLPAFSCRFKLGTVLKQVMYIRTVQNCSVSEQNVTNDSGNKVNTLLLMNTNIVEAKLEKNGVVSKSCKENPRG